MTQDLQVNKLYEENFFNIVKHWPDNSIDHCMVDPPYNISKENGLGWAFSSHVTMSEEWDTFEREDYLNFSHAWIKEVSRVVKKNGNIFIFGTYHNIYDIGHILSELDFRIINSIVWFKPNAQPNITCRMLTESTEYIIWACNNSEKKATKWTFNYEVAKALNNGKQMRNMWRIPYAPKREKEFGKHPAQKPVSVMARMILIATRPGDIILDCFAGTGTTGVVANKLNRKWIMVENKSEYAEIARKRLNAPVTFTDMIEKVFKKENELLSD
jgi:site-specific DNA-methyltransferase (adenine-specific)